MIHSLSPAQVLLLSLLSFQQLILAQEDALIHEDCATLSSALPDCIQPYLIFCEDIGRSISGPLLEPECSPMSTTFDIRCFSCPNDFHDAAALLEDAKTNDSDCQRERPSTRQPEGCIGTVSGQVEDRKTICRRMRREVPDCVGVISQCGGEEAICGRNEECASNPNYKVCEVEIDLVVFSEQVADPTEEEVAAENSAQEDTNNQPPQQNDEGAAPSPQIGGEEPQNFYPSTMVFEADPPSQSSAASRPGYYYLSWATIIATAAV